MPYILYGLNLAAHLALVGLLIFLCFRTKSKGLILISATLLIVKPTINFTLARLGNLASERVYSRNCCSLKCKHIFGFYYMYEIFGLIFQQVVKSDWWRWEPGKMRGEGILNMSALDLLLTVAMVHPLVYRCLCLLGVFLIYKEWRQGKFRYPPT